MSCTIIIALAVLVVGLVVVFLMGGFSRFGEESEDEQQLNLSSASDLSYADIAGHTLNWVLEQRDERGIFHSGIRCQDSESCESTGSSIMGAPSVWALSEYYSKVGGDRYLTEVESVLDTYLDTEIVRHPQVYSWHCRLLLEVAGEDNVTSEIQELAEKFCQGGNFMDELYDTILEDYPFANGFYPIISDVRDNDSEALYMSDNEYFIYRNASRASEYSVRFQRWDDEDDQKRAAGYLEHALVLLQQEWETKEFISYGGICALGIGAVDVYGVTGEMEYLTLARSALPDEFERYSSLSDHAHCSLLAQILYEETGEPGFAETRNTIVDLAIETMYDYEGYDGYFLGDGVFTSGHKYPILKPVFENCIMVYVLLNIE